MIRNAALFFMLGISGWISGWTIVRGLLTTKREHVDINDKINEDIRELRQREKLQERERQQYRKQFEQIRRRYH